MRRIAVWFLAAEGLGGILFWAALLLVPSTRGLFFPAHAERAFVGSLLVPDLVFFAGSALASCWALATRMSWAGPLLWLHTGAGVYAALLALSIPFATGAGWLGAAIMAPCLVILPYMAWRLHPDY